MTAHVRTGDHQPPEAGILFSSPTSNIEHKLRDWVGYRLAFAGFEIVVMAALAVVVLLGREYKGKAFSRQHL